MMFNKKYFLLLLIMMLSSCSHLFYFPDSNKYASPESFNLDYENIYFDSTDHVRLHAWHLKAKKPKGIVLFFHGNAQNLSSHFLSAGWIVNHGWDVFIFDYRGYGLSHHVSPTQKGLYEDGLSAINFTRNLMKKRNINRLVVLGQSLGGNVAMRVLQDTKREDIELVILDSTFLSYKKMAVDKLASNWITWILSPLGFVLVSDEYSPKKWMKDFDRPLIVIHGEEDRVVPVKFGDEINQVVKAEHTYWRIPKGIHTDVFHLHEKKYRKMLLTVLDKQ